MTSRECHQIFSMLSQYLDRELPADLCDEIESHIESCPPCVEFVQSLEKTVELCRKLDLAGGKPALSAEKLAELKAAYDAHFNRP